MARRPDVHAMVAQRDVPGLMDALRFEDASVRRDAAAALGRLGNTAAWSGRTAAGALCQVLAGYEETAAHEHRSLRHPSGTATTRLVRETPEVRLAAIEALALLVTAEPLHASPALSALLDETSASGEQEVRAAALQAMAAIASADPRAMDGLIAHRLAESGWLQPFSKREPPGPLMDLGEFLVRWLLTSAKAERTGDLAGGALSWGTCLDLLAWFGDAAAVEARRTLGDREPQSRMRAISTLARVAPNDIAPIASIAATDEDADVRHHAIAALGEMGGPAAHDALVDLLDGDDRTTRLAVVRAMRAAGDRRAVDAFISLAADDDPEMRQSAAAALAYLLEAHRSSMFPARLRDVVDDDAIDRVITAIADGAPDESWVASLNIRPRSLAKRACALTRERHRS